MIECSWLDDFKPLVHWCAYQCNMSPKVDMSKPSWLRRVYYFEVEGTEEQIKQFQFLLAWGIQQYNESVRK